MSIEQKIADLLEESKKLQEEQIEVVAEEVAEVVAEEVISEGEEIDYEGGASQRAAHEKKFGVKLTPKPGKDAAYAHTVSGEKANVKKFLTHHYGDAEDAKDIHPKAFKEELTIDVSEDVAALINGEELSEEFKTKAATIFEAAVVTRVKQEIAKLDEQFDTKLAEQVESIKEGLVEKVDGYLNYVVETWIAQNEIALERGMKSDILENFVSGLKDLFVESWIDVPEDKYDVLADMETQVSELQAKLDEQLAANVEMNKVIAEQARVDIIKDACNGLTDTEVEKFTGLAEELAFEDAESFATKVQTIRENYFTNKAGKVIVESVVTDTPVESLTEEKVIAPQMKQYMTALNNIK